ncbi:MAG: cytochrome b [Rhodoferax sp.]|uniref:cytochrome b n=1 Tax=Rhodoferax sp. TaxID=50421 RepID=UPI0017F285D1|nr:cytochrome b [Rhodoferax sp.]NMM12346.1 cytochrome b [Rhodoferax sp.]NMM18787.1 cytochrome b [Rhodoferax sp.]
MNFKKIPDRYNAISMSLHWLVLVLFIGIYASINLRELFDKGTETREALKSLHFMLGLLMFALVWLRLAMRLTYPAPRIEPAPPQWQELASKLTRLLLYVLMLGMPLIGWLMLSAAGKPVPFFGLTLPALIGANKELASQLKEIHELAGTLGYFLIGAHAAAALFHHYIKRDNTLLNMLPKRG